MGMSLAAYLTGGKIDSSSELRERLKWDALRARVEKVDLGVETVKPPQGGETVSPDRYDSVLRSHCRF
jgi:hypothetical protein